jgi:hypothetical protein
MELLPKQIFLAIKPILINTKKDLLDLIRSKWNEIRNQHNINC